MSHFREVESTDKLDLLMVAINKINTNFHYKLEDMHRELSSALKNVCEVVIPKVTSLQKMCEELQARIDDMEGMLPDIKQVNNHLQKIDNEIQPGLCDLQRRMELLERSQSQITDDVSTLKGFTQVQDKQITGLKSKVVDLTTRSMAQNIIIYGKVSDQEKQEDTKAKVLAFFCEKMLMSVDEDEVLVMH